MRNREGCCGGVSGALRLALSFLFAAFLSPTTRGQAPVNLALNQPVESSGPNWGSFKPAALTDGDPSTFTHPAADEGTSGFYYEVDLGGSRSLDRIVLRNRADGCCPERLSRVRVEIWAESADGGRQITWSTRLRADGSHSGVGGVDELRRELDPAGTFAGRYVRVVNESGAAYNPQLAEIEVYGGVLPIIRVFAANQDSLRSGEATVLRWEVEGATEVSISPGLGSVTPVSGLTFIAPAVTTAYVLTASNLHGSVRATVNIGVDEPLDPPELSEFMADNSGSLRDADGDSSDWIELWNPNRFELPLAGYALTADPRREGLWVFPEAKIPAHGFLVVFASGKDRREPGRELHTDFRLRAGGGTLALIDRDGRSVLRSFPPSGAPTDAYPAQSADTSYGVSPEGVVGFFRPATPGATNGTAYAGRVADTRFSRDRGFYETNLVVEITCATPGAVIRYTTDRSLPSASRGQIYTGPIAITNTTVLRAAAFKEGWAPTDVDTQTYLLRSNILSSSVLRRTIVTNVLYRDRLPAALQQLPSFSLVSAATINDTTEVAASLEWVPADASGGEPRQVDCGVQQFGGAFTDFAKKSFRLYFRGRYGAPRFVAPLFEGFDRGWASADEFDQLELRSGSHDMAMRGFYLSNPFTDDTQLEMGQLAPHGRWVHLFLNGTYWGVYHLRERWGGAMHRSYLGGPDDGYESINGNWNVGGWAEPGTPYDGTGATWTRLKSLRKDYRAARAWLDVPQFVDYMILWMFGGAEDEYRCVGPVVPGSGFKFYLNDADGWLCIPQYCASGNRTTRRSPGRLAGDGPGSLFSMLFAGADPDYRVLLADRIQRALTGDGALTPTRNAERLNRRCAELSDAFLLESARWNYLSPTEWTRRRDSVLGSWFPARTAQVLSDFRGAGFLPSLAAPTLTRAAGRVTNGTPVGFSAPSTTTVWYTLDGSDPRLPGGAVSPSAVSYAVGSGGAVGLPAFTVTRNTRLLARARSTSQWSALTEAFFQVRSSALQSGDLLVRELHFQPPGVDAAEYLKLENVSSEVVNLRGARLVDGVTFAFADLQDLLLSPGQSLLLVSDLYRFRETYGLDVPVAGVFRGRLANEGEMLRLLDAHGSVVLETRFGGSVAWPQADGRSGFSWVQAYPEFGADVPEAWRPGALREGTPTGDDRVSFVGLAEVDEDSDGFPAIVEYALGTSDRDAGEGRGRLVAGLDSGGRFTVRVPRRLGADDVRLAVESSEDLRSWALADRLSIRWVSPGQGEETWGVMAGDRRQVFLRCRVERRTVRGTVVAPAQH